MSSMVGMRAWRGTGCAAMLVAAVLLALVAVAPAPVRAAGGTYYVGSTDGTASVTTGCTTNGNTTCTLRGALAQNATDSSGGTVRFSSAFPAAATTIDISGGGTLTLANNVTIDGTGKRVAISGGGSVRVFQVNGGITASLVALTVTGGNSATSSGGGILNNGGTLTLTNSTVSGNTAGLSSGGGISSESGGTLTLVNSTVSGNSAGGGGGIANGGTLTLVNSTVSGNFANASGGIENGGTTTLVNSTVSGNSASIGVGGVRNGAGTVTARNTIIAGNTGGDTQNTITNDQNSSLIGVAVPLGPLADNGGLTQTMLPLPGTNTAIDAGNAAICAAAINAAPPGAGGADQRGMTRPQGAGCDVGAVEVRGAVVNNTGDGTADAARCADGNANTCRLRDAIAAVETGGPITFSSLFNTAQTITLTNSQLLIDRDMTITGPGANLLTVSGNMMSRVFRIGVGCGCGAVVEISGLTITGGNGVSGGGNTGGGGILNRGQLTLKNVVVSGNTAMGGGGGIRNNTSGYLTIFESTISGNSSDEGGGIRNAGLAIITRSTISGNQTLAGMSNNGGGISNNAGLFLTNVTISGNSTGGTGGGLRNSGGSLLQLINVTISGNTATANGGGVRNLGMLDATNSIIAGNTGTGDDLNNNQGGMATTTTNNLISTAMAPINPLLAPLGSYGGPTQTRPPLPGSPALDAGDNAACADSETPFSVNNLDQRGVTRPQGTTCDIGAVEIRGFMFAATGGTPQSATVGQNFAALLETTLSETGGSPLPGASVAFAAPMTGASATLMTSPATTDASGKASVIATANLAPGMYNVTASAGGGTSATFALTNVAPTITVTPASLSAGVVGATYPAQTFAASGGTSMTYTFALAPMSGPLPPGLMLAGNTLTGTPTTAGMFTFTLRATDANMFTGDKSYTVTINAAVSIAPASLPNGTVGVAYSQTLAANGGTGAGYTFAVVPAMGQQLPPGLMLNGMTGAIAGTPTMAGMFTFTVSATDSGMNTATKQYIVTILSAVVISPASLPNGTVGVAYSQTLAANGGTGAGYTFAVVPTMGEQVPPGLTLAASGTLSGTPTMQGMFAFTVRATDGGMNAGTRQYTVTVGTATLTSIAATRASGGTVTGGVVSVPAGGTVQLALTATFSDGTMQPVPGGAMWTSSDPNKATVDASGRVTSLSPGMVTITVMYMGQTTTFTLTVTPPGTGGLVPNPAPAVRPADAATVPAPVAPVPPTRAAGNTGGGIGPQGSGTATPTPRPAPPTR